MKFGKQIKRLADPAILNHYLAYDVLKKAINVVAPNAQPEEGQEVLGKSAQPAESRFYELLQHEMCKVNRFFQLQLRTLLDKFREAQRALHSVQRGEGAELLARANRLLEEAADGLVELDKFKYLNFTGFRKIAKKFDKSTKSGVTLSSWFMPQLKRAFFAAHPLDGLLLSLSLGYAAVRRFQSGTRREVPPPKMPPNTMTFCMTPLGRMRSLCTLVKSFQVVLPPQQGHVASEGMSGEEFSSELRKLLYALGTEGLHVPCRIATQMTAEYFDSPQDGYPFYQSHLKASTGEGQSLGFRCRQTGERGDVVEMDCAGSSVGVNAFTPVQLGSPDAFPLEGPLESSSLERLKASAEATMQKAQAKDPALMASCGEPGCRELATFASQVAGACASYRLETVATIGASRLLLRGDTDDTCNVRMAMDEEVQFARAPGGQVSQAVDFPYCMLEVSGENLSDAKWLDELRCDAVLREAPNFNVGVQAIAALRKEDVPALPHWYHAEDSFDKPEEFGPALQRRADEYQAQEAREEAKQRSGSVPDRTSKVLTAVEPALGETNEAEMMLQPKDLLASERTMLEWMHTVFALAVIAIGLWRYSLTGNLPRGKALTPSEGVRSEFFNTSSPSRLLLGVYSLFLVLVAICFGWYAVISHLQRIKALMKNEQKDRIFNRRAGPTIFAGCMALALVAHLGLQLA
mmetsp:Transcript_104649/g.127817  ORF Transcript_104649/g.127817 Transcript_104649/m.127817 type:complete len:691 (+) Transcript_104649:72-2144(+)